MGLLESMNKQNNLIQKYKIKCAVAKKLLSTIPPKCAQVSTNIGPILSQMPSHTSTTVNALQPQIISKPNRPTTNSEKSVRAKETLDNLKCPDCSYIARKKDALTVHRTEFCINKPIKDRPCKFCSKLFATRRALRVHINQYLNGKHTPSGDHKSVSLADHKAYLDEIKDEIK